MTTDQLAIQNYYNTPICRVESDSCSPIFNEKVQKVALKVVAAISITAAAALIGGHVLGAATLCTTAYGAVALVALAALSLRQESKIKDFTDPKSRRQVVEDLHKMSFDQIEKTYTFKKLFQQQILSPSLYCHILQSTIWNLGFSKALDTLKKCKEYIEEYGDHKEIYFSSIQEAVLCDWNQKWKSEMKGIDFLDIHEQFTLSDLQMLNGLSKDTLETFDRLSKEYQIGHHLQIEAFKWIERQYKDEIKSITEGHEACLETIDEECFAIWDSRKLNSIQDFHSNQNKLADRIFQKKIDDIDLLQSELRKEFSIISGTVNEKANILHQMKDLFFQKMKLQEELSFNKKESSRYFLENREKHALAISQACATRNQKIEDACQNFAQLSRDITDKRDKNIQAEWARFVALKENLNAEFQSTLSQIK